jgi:hypothetical protein
MPAKAGRPVATGAGVYWIAPFAGDDGPRPKAHTPIRPYIAFANSVGVLPVTWRNACENAGTLA